MDTIQYNDNVMSNLIQKYTFNFPGANLSKSPFLLKNSFNPNVYKEYQRIKQKEFNLKMNCIIKEPEFKELKDDGS